MSALAYSYSEPYKLPAGALALVVHGAFFALLYFGVNWHNEQPQGMVVDIWNALPAPQAEPVKVMQQPVTQVEQPRPVAPPKPDIVLPAKKKPKIKPPAPVKTAEIKPAPPKKAESAQVDQKVRAAQVAQEGVEAERAAQAAAAAAAITNEVGKYIGLIRSKIRSKIVMPQDVPDNIQAEFKVILLPDGSVLSTKLTKPSGNTAYDDEVERAIMKAQRLPLPPDAALFSKFREMNLTFRPKE
jgi:colicin import membrane protein